MTGIFFFSSRRRHTRLQGDWSSDVCSSDLHRLLAMSEADGFREELADGEHGEPVEQLLRCDRDRVGDHHLGDRCSLQARSEERRVGKEDRWGWTRVFERTKKREMKVGCSTD